MAEDRDILAGEYVLGTLDAAERDVVERQRRSDPDLQRAIADWERRLHPLTDTVAEATPRGFVWTAIEAEIDRYALEPNGAGRAAATMPPNPRSEAAVIVLRRRVNFWRFATAGAGLALAASLAALAIVGPWLKPQNPSHYVAVVNAGGQLPALIVNVDTGAGLVSVRSVAAAAPANRSLELWYIGAGQQPRSMGVMDQVGATIRASTSGFGGFRPSDIIFAVTDEPLGGSPSGQPTGAIVYSGKLIAVPE